MPSTCPLQKAILQVIFHQLVDAMTGGPTIFRRSVRIFVAESERSIVMASHPIKKKKAFSPLLLLLIVPFIALCWPPFYNFHNPEIIGIPFFYWFQMLWIIITAVITAVLYFLGS